MELIKAAIYRETFISFCRHNDYYVYGFSLQGVDYSGKAMIPKVMDIQSPQQQRTTENRIIDDLYNSAVSNINNNYFPTAKDFN